MSTEQPKQEHGLSLVQSVSGAWYAGCHGCPEWCSGPAVSPQGAAQQHRDAHLATMTPFERAMALFVGGPVVFVLIPLWVLWTGGAL